MEVDYFYSVVHNRCYLISDNSFKLIHPCNAAFAFALNQNIYHSLPDPEIEPVITE